MVALLLVPATAFAGPREDATEARANDLSAVIDAFDFPRGDDLDAVGSLYHDVTLSCSEQPIVEEYDAMFEQVTERCTGTVATSDSPICRGAAVLALIKHRDAKLDMGDGHGLAFDITCDGYVITGNWTAYFPGSVLPANGLLSVAEHTTGGDSMGSWSLSLAWEKAAPDVDDPEQWMVAIMQPVTDAEAGADRVIAGIARGEGETVRGLVVDEVAHSLTELDAFPGFPDDEKLRTAARTYLEWIWADLDHGDLKKLVVRSGAGASTKKSFTKKTRAIEKHRDKAIAKQQRKLEAALARFQKSHGI
jgi:hypothetical protein